MAKAIDFSKVFRKDSDSNCATILCMQPFLEHKNLLDPRGVANSGEAEDWQRAPESRETTLCLRKRSRGDNLQDSDHGSGPAKGSEVDGGRLLV
ncbi:UPF0449 protein C19orf25 homolog isoform X3 [Narcine bancroftii]|uniref:UPF0449 protein C19orf25 homolog isoform X3 n=1 Tax=Narcine bancroftii TaxID=1343680 RepID=UPI00383202DE